MENNREPRPLIVVREIQLQRRQFCSIAPPRVFTLGHKVPRSVQADQRRRLLPWARVRGLWQEKALIGPNLYTNSRVDE